MGYLANMVTLPQISNAVKHHLLLQQACPHLQDGLVLGLVTVPAHRLNQPLIIPPARFRARPEPYIAFEAKPLA